MHHSLNIADILLDEDNFTLSFGTVNAIAMFFITLGVMSNNDIALSAGGTLVGHDAAAAPLPSV